MAASDIELIARWPLSLPESSAGRLASCATSDSFAFASRTHQTFGRATRAGANCGLDRSAVGKPRDELHLENARYDVKGSIMLGW